MKAGQRLYKIDPAPYIAALNNAKATLRRRRPTRARTRRPSATRCWSRQRGQQAGLRQRRRRARPGRRRRRRGQGRGTTAQINLGYTDVVSPITGRTGVSQVTPGAYVQASAATLLTTVQQLDPIYVDLTQSSVDGLQLRREIASGQLKLTAPTRRR